MTAAPGCVDCVVDASVGIKLFLVEPLSDRADHLFDGLAAPLATRLYVPDLFVIECTNILWKYVRHYGYPPSAAQQDITELLQLPLHIASTSSVAEDALRLAVAHEITAYDAAYVALSERLMLPLVTADERLVHCLADTDLDVRFLGDWP
jgi:predicted nucleic acid-binding protein